MPEQVSLDQFTDDDAAAVIVRAVRTVGVLAVAGAAVALWRGGWQSAVLLLIGCAISASGLWEWRRLMRALMLRMAVPEGETPLPGQRPSIGFAIVGMSVRLMVAVVVLYVSLRYLNGSVLALAAGLATGVFALTVEGIRLLRSGTF